MTLFKETGDFILLSYVFYEMILINDNDFLSLSPSCVSQNLDLPFTGRYNLIESPVILTTKKNIRTFKKLRSQISAWTGCFYNNYVVSLKIQNL